MSLNQDDLKAVIQRYQARIAEHGVNFASMASGSLAKQHLRHSIHASALRPTTHPTTVLDIGCGLGQFYHYLQAEEIAVQYTGYDIVPEYVDTCRTMYPDSHFEQRNIFDVGIDGHYDTVVMSQVLNNRYRQSSNVAVMEQALKLAFAHSRVSVSVDMMSNQVDYENPDLFYYDPAQLLQIARRITRRVIVRHDYRPFEFCVQLFHADVAGYIA